MAIWSVLRLGVRSERIAGGTLVFVRLRVVVGVLAAVIAKPAAQARAYEISDEPARASAGKRARRGAHAASHAAGYGADDSSGNCARPHDVSLAFGLIAAGNSGAFLID